MANQFEEKYRSHHNWSRYEPNGVTAEALAQVYSREVSLELPALPPLTVEQIDDMHPYVD